MLSVFKLQQRRKEQAATYRNLIAACCSCKPRPHAALPPQRPQVCPFHSPHASPTSKIHPKEQNQCKDQTFRSIQIEVSSFPKAFCRSNTCYDHCMDFSIKPPFCHKTEHYKAMPCCPSPRQHLGAQKGILGLSHCSWIEIEQREQKGHVLKHWRLGGPTQGGRGTITPTRSPQLGPAIPCWSQNTARRGNQGESEPLPPNRWQQCMETRALLPAFAQPQPQVSGRAQDTASAFKAEAKKRLATRPHCLPSRAAAPPSGFVP